MAPFHSIGDKCVPKRATGTNGERYRDATAHSHGSGLFPGEGPIYAGRRRPCAGGAWRLGIWRVPARGCGWLKVGLPLRLGQGNDSEPRLGQGNDSEPMLTALTTGLRFRLAIALAAFAALCFVAPPAVLAFGHGANTINCLAHANMVDHGRVASHDAKHHGDHSSPAGNHQMTCCGLFCLSALAADSAVIDPVAAVSAPFPARETSLFSRVAERLDRPPIPLLFV